MISSECLISVLLNNVFLFSMDLQYVGDESLVLVRYVTGYVGKHEKGIVTLKLCQVFKDSTYV